MGKEGGERDGGASSERSVREKGRKRIERHTKILMERKMCVC